MKRFLEAIPLPIGGLISAFASMGNLLKAVFTQILKMPDLAQQLYHFCFIVTTILLFVMLLKMLFCFKMVVDAIENPEMFGIFTVYTLAIMVWTGYLPTFVNSQVAQVA